MLSGAYQWSRVGFAVSKGRRSSVCIKHCPHHLEPESKLRHVVSVSKNVKPQTHVAKQRIVGFSLCGVTFVEQDMSSWDSWSKKKSLLRHSRLSAFNHDCKTMFIFDRPRCHRSPWPRHWLPWLKIMTYNLKLEPVLELLLFKSKIYILLFETSVINIFVQICRLVGQSFSQYPSLRLGIWSLHVDHPFGPIKPLTD